VLIPVCDQNYVHGAMYYIMK